MVICLKKSTKEKNAKIKTLLNRSNSNENSEKKTTTKEKDDSNKIIDENKSIEKSKVEQDKNSNKKNI